MEKEETEEEFRNVKERKTPSLIKNIICGIAMGAGAILPGVSAGVLCVIFGVYPLLMETLANPIKGVRKHWKILLSIGTGWICGFFIFAKLIQWIFEVSDLYATWLFVGLIAGTVPSLFKEAGKKGRTKGSYVSMIGSGILLIAILVIVKYIINIKVEPNMGWFTFGGVLWGLSFVIPGLSSSPMLLALGLYEPLNNGLVSLDWHVILPWLVGMCATALLLARAVNLFFKKKASLAYHAVAGIVAASTLMIIPLYYESMIQILIGILLGAVGYLVAYISEKMDLKVKTAEED